MAGEAALDLSRSRSLFGQAQPIRRIPGGGRGRRAFDVTRALEEIEESEAEMQNRLPDWRATFNLTMPDRNCFDGQTAGSSRIPQELHDAYGVRAMRRGMGNLIGAMTPPEQPWAAIVGGSSLPARKRESIAKGLERVTEVFFDYLGKSRFATEAHTMAGDLMVSTGFLTIDKGTRQRPLRVQAVPLQQCRPVEGPDGEIENVYRKYQVKPGHLEREWPGLVLSSRLRRIASSTPRTKVEPVEATTFEEGRGYRFTIFDPADRAILYDVEPTDPNEPSRWITPRLYKRPGESFGIGAASEALPTLRSLNKERELLLKGRARYGNPPLLIDSLSGQNPHTMRLSPNAVGMINGAALGNRPPFYSLPANAPAATEYEAIRDDRALIDDIMFATEVVGSSDDLKGVTAFAVSVRRQQLLLQQGVDLGRLQREFPFAVMRRGVWVLSQLGIIDPPINIDDLIFAVEYLGPLAQAQKADKASNVLAFVSQLRGTVGDQMATLAVKMEDVGSVAGRMWPGVPDSLLRDEDEREEIQKQAAMVAAQQAAGQAPALDESALPGAGQSFLQ